MKQFECPYFDECGLLCSQTNENCRIKELFEDFYKVEKLYVEANVKCEQLKAENEKLSTQNYYLDEANLELAEENENYLQCLDEIEDIANTLECDCAIRDILQKLKEVKGDE